MTARFVGAALCASIFGATSLLGGCGSGRDDVATSNAAASRVANGRVMVNIHWPTRTAASRLFPEATNLVVVQAFRTVNGVPKMVATGQATRSSSGGDSTISLDKLPVDALTVVATAYPGADVNAPGVSLAAGSVAVMTLDGQTVNFSVTMNTAIDHLSVSPNIATIAAGKTLPFSVTAWSGSNESTSSMVLLSADKVQWSSSAPSIASVASSTGLSNTVTASAVGTASVSVKDTESTKSDVATVVVIPVLATPTPIPTATPTPTPTPTSTPSTAQYTATEIVNPDPAYTLGGLTYGRVNSSGQVAWGWKNSGNYHAVLYTPGNGFKDLGNLGGTGNTFPNGLNDSGDVVGSSHTSGGATHAFLYKNGALQDIGSGAVSSEAEAINASGQVVGISNSHAFLFTAGVLKDLGALATGTSSRAYAVNANGAVVGDSATNGISGSHAFLYSYSGSMQDLGTFAGGTISFARAINADGQIAGDYDDSTSSQHAFLYSGGQMHSVEMMSGVSFVWSNATDINDSGQIVGVFKLTASGLTYAFVYQDGRLQNLNDITSGLNGVTLEYPFNITSNGLILAIGFSSDNAGHLMVLTPTGSTKSAKPYKR